MQKPGGLFWFLPSRDRFGMPKAPRGWVRMCVSRLSRHLPPLSRSQDAGSRQVIDEINRVVNVRGGYRAVQVGAFVPKRAISPCLPQPSRRLGSRPSAGSQGWGEKGQNIPNRCHGPSQHRLRPESPGWEAPYLNIRKQPREPPSSGFANLVVGRKCRPEVIDQSSVGDRGWTTWKRAVPGTRALDHVGHRSHPDPWRLSVSERRVEPQVLSSMVDRWVGQASTPTPPAFRVCLVCLQLDRHKQK